MRGVWVRPCERVMLGCGGLNRRVRGYEDVLWFWWADHHESIIRVDPYLAAAHASLYPYTLTQSTATTTTGGSCGRRNGRPSRGWGVGKGTRRRRRMGGLIRTWQRPWALGASSRVGEFKLGLGLGWGGREAMCVYHSLRARTRRGQDKARRPPIDPKTHSKGGPTRFNICLFVFSPHRSRSPIDPN